MDGPSSTSTKGLKKKKKKCTQAGKEGGEDIDLFIWIDSLEKHALLKKVGGKVKVSWGEKANGTLGRISSRFGPRARPTKRRIGKNSELHSRGKKTKNAGKNTKKDTRLVGNRRVGRGGQLDGEKKAENKTEFKTSGDGKYPSKKQQNQDCRFQVENRAGRNSCKKKKSRLQKPPLSKIR